MPEKGLGEIINPRAAVPTPASRSPIPRLPQTDEEKVRLRDKNLGMLKHPAVRAGLMQFGLSLMSGRRRGQSVGDAAGAVGRFYKGSDARVEQQQNRMERQQGHQLEVRGADRADRQIDAQVRGAETTAGRLRLDERRAGSQADLTGAQARYYDALAEQSGTPTNPLQKIIYEASVKLFLGEMESASLDPSVATPSLSRLGDILRELQTQGGGGGQMPAQQSLSLSAAGVNQLRKKGLSDEQILSQMGRVPFDASALQELGFNRGVGIPPTGVPPISAASIIPGVGGPGAPPAAAVADSSLPPLGFPPGSPPQMNPLPPNRAGYIPGMDLPDR